jgi:outer membrane protein assembly factor BamB
MRAFLFILAFNLTAVADDWPCFRGPNHDGISKEKGWRSVWPKAGLKQVWKAKVGIGFSSVSVANGMAFTLGHTAAKDTVYCLDAKTGKEVWRNSWPSAIGAKFYIGGPGSTPTAAGDHVYVTGKWGEVMCLARKTGKIVWQRNVTKEDGVRVPTWGFNGSALVQGERVLINAGTAGMALDRKTGKTLWKSVDGEAGYATPYPIMIDGKSHIVVSSGRAYSSVNVADGKEAWSIRWFTRYGVNAANAIVHDGNVFIGSGYRKGCGLFKMATEPKEIWKNKNLSTQCNGAVKIGEHLYGFDGDSGGGGHLRCVDWKTGKIVWEEKIGFGSVMAADGKLIVLTAKGVLSTAPASPKGFSSTGRAQVLEADCWTTPVLANGLLYCRNSKGDLVCLDLHAEQ